MVYAISTELYQHVTPVSLVYTVDGYLFGLNLSYMHLIDYLYWLDIDAALSLSGDVHTHFLPLRSVVNIITRPPVHVYCFCSD